MWTRLRSLLLSLGQAIRILREKDAFQAVLLICIMLMFTLDAVLDGKCLETEQDGVKQRPYSFEVPLSVLEVTIMFMFLYDYVFDQ